MAPTANAPFFDGQGASFSNYAQEVELLSRTTNLGTVKRASALVLKADPVAREVCMGAGSDQKNGPGWRDEDHATVE